jgi:hypothetical protein
MGHYHHSHNWLGMNNQTTIEVKVDWAQDTVNFTGCHVDNDRFISAPY